MNTVSVDSSKEQPNESPRTYEMCDCIWNQLKNIASQDDTFRQLIEQEKMLYLDLIKLYNLTKKTPQLIRNSTEDNMPCCACMPTKCVEEQSYPCSNWHPCYSNISDVNVRPVINPLCYNVPCCFTPNWHHLGTCTNSMLEIAPDCTPIRRNDALIRLLRPVYRHCQPTVCFPQVSITWLTAHDNEPAKSSANAPQTNTPTKPDDTPRGVEVNDEVLHLTTEKKRFSCTGRPAEINSQVITNKGSSTANCPIPQSNLYIWIVNGVKALHDQGCGQWSEPFYLGCPGYRMRAKIEFTTHYLGIFVRLVVGEYDHCLRWPFDNHLQFVVIDQTLSGRNIARTLKPFPQDEDERQVWMRPSLDSAEFLQPGRDNPQDACAWGLPDMILLSMVFGKSVDLPSEYIRNDQLYITIRLL